MEVGDGFDVIEASVVPEVGDVDSDTVRIGAFGARRETDVGLEYCIVVARPLTTPSSLIDAVQFRRGVHQEVYVIESRDGGLPGD